MGVLEQQLRKTAVEFKKKHPYSKEELLKIIETCQNSVTRKGDTFSSLEQEVCIIYWYYIEDICRSIHRFYPSSETYFDTDDLIGEAVLHLFDAVRTYDLHGNVPFSCWIMRISRNAVSKTVWENQRSIRIPKGFAKKISSYLAYTADHITETGFPPTRQEAMADLSLTDGECQLLERYASSGHTGNTREPEDAFSVEKQAVELYVKDAMQDILKEYLSPEENSFLSMSMGLNGSARYDTELLSKLFGVTSGEVIAIFHVIKEKLKENRKLRELAESCLW